MKNSTYFLIRDILSCFPTTVERNLTSVLNAHHVFKKSTRQIFVEEVKSRRPAYRILCGALIMQNTFLRQYPQIAFYEVSDIIPELKYCFFKDKRKTIKRLSAETILRLFVTLYF